MRSIGTIGLQAAVREILPMMAEAGELARRLQGPISAGAGRSAKTLGNPFADALTDADVLIESVVGTKLFQTFDDIRFEGEEKASDRISQFFSQDAPYTVTFDPINGTLYYQDGLPVFDIILTICKGQTIVAAITYLPCTGKAYVAVQGEGARVYDGWSLGTWPSRLVLPKQPERTIIVNDGVRRHWQAFEDAGFRVIDAVRDYRRQKDWPYACNAIFTGPVAALCKTDGQLIDIGANAFIVKEAGGAWNDPTFDPATLKAPLLVNAVSQEIYDEIQAIMAE